MKAMWSVVCVAVVLGVVGPGTVVPAAAAVQSFDNLLPDNAIVYASVRNVPELLGKLKQTAGYKIFMQLRPFERLSSPDKYAEAQHIYGTFIEPLGTICTGEVALVLTSLENVNERPHLGLLIDVSESQAALDKFLDETIYPFLKEHSVEWETQEVAGVKVTRINPDPDNPTAIFFTVKDGVLIVAFNDETLGELLSYTGPGVARAMLPSNAGYADVRAALGRTDLTVYVNVGLILSRALADGAGAKEAVLCRAGGMEKLRAVGVGTAIGPDGSGTSTIRLSTSGPPRGWLALAAGEAKPFKSLKRAPRETGFYYAVNLGDPEELYAKFVELLEMVSEQTDEDAVEEFTNAVGQAEAVLGMNLADEILPAFGGELALVVDVPKTIGIPPAVLMIEVKDKETVGEFVARVLELVEAFGEGGVQLTTTEHNGVEITTVLASPMMSPGVAVLDDFLVVGTSGNAVRAVVDAAAGNTIEAREDFAATMVGLPTSGTGMLYVDFRELFEFVFPILAAQAPDEESVRELIAELGKLGEHLSGFAIVASGDESGVTWRARSRNALLEPVMIIGPAVFLPAFMGAREVAQGAASTSNLRQLSVAIMQYELDHGTTPQKLSELVPDYVTGVSAFVHPENEDKLKLIDLDKPETIDEHADYELLLKGAKLNDLADGSVAPLIWEKEEFTRGQRTICYADGHTEQHPGDSKVVTDIKAGVK